MSVPCSKGQHTLATTHLDIWATPNLLPRNSYFRAFSATPLPLIAMLQEEIKLKETQSKELSVG
jgi:hypothetical protein